MNCKKYFITKNYKAQFSAAGKAKIDCEQTLERIGFKNIGLNRTTFSNSIIGSILTFTGTFIGLIRLKKGSTICIQYPIKKYYNIIVKIAKLKKCKVITIIHDLRSHRKGKVSVKTEINSLNRNNVIISHNSFMSSWLKSNRINTKTVDLEIFDYLSNLNKNTNTHKSLSEKYSLVFAGVLEKRKNGFIYALDNLHPKHFMFNLYGIGFNKNKLSSESIINYKGFFPADEVVNKLSGNFGLVWDGISTEECAGNFGEYLKINNPHKTSLYLRAGLPIIIWDQAALSKFVTDNKVGISISSLKNLDEKLEQLTDKEYLKMKENALIIGEKIGNGFYLEKAIKQS